VPTEKKTKRKLLFTKQHTGQRIWMQFVNRIGFVIIEEKQVKSQLNYLLAKLTDLFYALIDLLTQVFDLLQLGFLLGFLGG
jgi:hypothetical protein